MSIGRPFVVEREPPVPGERSQCITRDRESDVGHQNID
jgi:hypothetical protein